MCVCVSGLMPAQRHACVQRAHVCVCYDVAPRYKATEHDLDVVVGHSYPFDDKKIEIQASRSRRCDVEVNFPPSLRF